MAKTRLLENMSMLVKRRRKKKCSVDPQRKRWNKDNKKVDQKMFEEMGWTNEKKLNVNKQGIIEHVRVNKNSEYEKAGYNKDLHMKDLHKHYDKFNDFSQLSKHHNQEETMEKLESNKEDFSDQALKLKSMQSRVQLQQWNKKGRMTKKMLKKLLYGNLIADFPGSNIQEIKGYGVDINC